MNNLFNYEDLVVILYNKLFYEQNLIYTINEKHEVIKADKPQDLNDTDTVKIEGLERYNKKIYDYGRELAKRYKHVGPVTCHAFIAKKNSPSFSLHSDPDNIIIYCVEGTKTLIVNDIEIVLNKDEHIFINAGTKHKAINNSSSIILSFGLEKFLVEKI